MITEIWVAAGTYEPDQGASQTPGDRTATFRLVNSVAILGGFAGTESVKTQRDPIQNETILCGDLVGDDGSDFANNDENSFHVVSGSDTDSTAVIDGFTITGGNANGQFPDIRGGGMVIVEGSPVVRNCTFRGNQGGFGGGLDNRASSATVENCSFIGNDATSVGGGIDINAFGTARVTNCIFTGNTAGSGAGLHHDGGGLELP